MLLIKPSFKILPHMEYASMLNNVCEAISHCYKAERPKTFAEQEAFIAKRIKIGHDSVLEHASFSATLVVDRGITHELVRHRLCSFTQESTRYCNYSKEKFGGNVTFVMPPFVQALVQPGQYHVRFDAMVPEGDIRVILCNESTQQEIVFEDPAVELWIACMNNCEGNYLHAVQEDENKHSLMSAQIARSMLPNATKAEITMTANMREWRHIFRLRALGTTGAPHPQMVEIMTPFLEEACQRFPVFFRDLVG